MKRFVSLFLTIIILMSLLIACNNIDYSSMENGSNEVLNESLRTTTTQSSDNLLNINNATSQTTQINQSTISNPMLEKYKRFDEAVNNNEYDKWLEKVSNEGIMSLNQIYGKYCSYWKNELDFTVAKAKILFKNQEDYLIWKEDLSSWLEITQKAYQNESDQMDVSMNRLEISIPYSKLIRQKVIDVKYFCYILECNVINNDSDNPIGLQWANDLSIQQP